MHAEERLAAFLLNLSARYKARGYSSTEFVLRMTREEIGSYLGLKLETVSRLFSKFHEEGLVQVQGRRIKIIDMPTVAAARQPAGVVPPVAPVLRRSSAMRESRASAAARRARRLTYVNGRRDGRCTIGAVSPGAGRRAAAWMPDGFGRPKTAATKTCSRYAFTAEGGRAS